MSVYKCKMCGGTLELHSGETVAVCEYCGTKQTLPRLDNERKANLYDRANHFRRNDEFDKAINIYEQILNEDNTDADTYWSLVLCRYGIEYVEDPDSHKRVPTVNRAQYTSVFDDENYKLALQYADVYQRAVYEEEAKAINEIQKQILTISQREEPFDVFICYKEEDESGKRTPDSVLAQELYYELTEEGFNVFFARITLEDKLGSAYEPYIFAALNSAKVMVVLGTKPEFFNAVWVKNEWSRYLALIKEGSRKMLIPAYKDMDPYDLPEEFSNLQAQDVSKLGFMQDLIHGIKKMVQSEDEKETEKEITGSGTSGIGGTVNSVSLLKRVFMFLEDGDWESADEYCERVLDMEPENAQAYLGKLMAELKVRKPSDLAMCEKSFQGSMQYQKIMRFGDEKLTEELKGYISSIQERSERIRLEKIYAAAVLKMSTANKPEDFAEAAQAFKLIKEYKDSAALAEVCLERGKVCRKNVTYNSAKEKKLRKQYAEAIKLFESIPGWLDADEQVSICRQEAEKKAKRKIKRRIFAIAGLCAAAVFFIVLFQVIIPNSKYNHAVELMREEKYEEAVAEFIAMDGYKDSEQQIVGYYIEKYGEEAYSQVKDIQIGDIYAFGAYEQDGSVLSGKEAIEWIVLDKRGAALLLISRYLLDYKFYNLSKEGEVIWEDCSLREWLNGEFLNSAFGSKEWDRIVPYKLENGSENSTTDRVFLLSTEEAEKYFVSDTESIGKEIVYREGNYAGFIERDWWLRKSGKNMERAAIVNKSGDVEEKGKDFDGLAGVRPAMWVLPMPE